MAFYLSFIYIPWKLSIRTDIATSQSLHIFHQQGVFTDTVIMLNSIKCKCQQSHT